MKPIRRILLIISFIIMLVPFLVFVLLTPIQWIIFGEIDLPERGIKFMDKVFDFINPNKE